MTKEKIQDKIDKLEQKYQDAYEYYGFASHELVLIEKQIEQLENDLQALIKFEQMELALRQIGFFVGGLTDEGIEYYYTKLIN
jgi:hypothetical protein